MEITEILMVHVLLKRWVYKKWLNLRDGPTEEIDTQEKDRHNNNNRQMDILENWVKRLTDLL